VHGAAGDSGRGNYLKSLVTMLHGLSIQVFAEGVAEQADATLLWQIGIDGITGPWASARRGDLVGD
jgi:EAL domain-containing protein (putative c-di-GMP-specific phosphodiesterase class I)